MSEDLKAAFSAGWDAGYDFGTLEDQNNSPAAWEAYRALQAQPHAGGVEAVLSSFEDALTWNSSVSQCLDRVRQIIREERAALAATPPAHPEPGMGYTTSPAAVAQIEAIKHRPIDPSVGGVILAAPADIAMQEALHPEGLSPAGSENPIPYEFAEELRERLLMIAESDHLRGRHTHLNGEIRAMGRIVRTGALCLGRPIAPPATPTAPDGVGRAPRPRRQTHAEPLTLPNREGE